MKGLQRHEDRPDFITLNLVGGGSIHVPAASIQEVVNKGKFCEVKLVAQRVNVLEDFESLTRIREAALGLDSPDRPEDHAGWHPDDPVQ